MGQSSEWAIELHNERMASDEEYAEEFYRTDAEYQAWFEWREEQIDTGDYRIDHSGFEEPCE